MESSQADMAKILEKLDAKLDEQAKQLDILNRKFDELTGAKKFLIWLTGTILVIAGILEAWFHNNK